MTPAATTVRQRDGTVLPIQRHALDEPLVLEVPEVTITHVEGGVARVVQVTLGNHPKCANGRECPRVGTIECVVTIPVVDQA